MSDTSLQIDMALTTAILYDARLWAAWNVADRAHAGQVRRFTAPGDPDHEYITHPLRVAAVVLHRTGDQELAAAAILHDVIEDTSYTLETLRTVGFTDRVIEVVDALTRREGETYAEFLDRVLQSRDATIVKIADVEDNYGSLPKSERKLHARYESALKVLKGSA